MNYYESDDSQHGAYSTSSLTAGTFYHLVGTVSKSTGVVKVYVNGVKEGENNIAIGGAPSTNNSTWKIGTANAGSEAYSYPAHGVIDEVRIYDKALDASEVEMLFLQYY
jgi:hypothetical protein